MSRPSPPSTFSARSSLSSTFPLNQQSPLKVTLLGPASSGKTALRRRFIKGDFTGSYRATIGCDFMSRSIVIPGHSLGSGDELCSVDLQLWDTAGQERFKSISAPFYRGSLACILTFDYTTTTNERQLRGWYTEFRDKCDTVTTREKFCWIVVGCKADLVDEKERKRIEKRIRKEVKSWFNHGNSDRAADEEEEDGSLKPKDFPHQTQLRVGPQPRKIPTPSSATVPSQVPPSSSHTSCSTITPSHRRPSLSKTSSASTIASVSLSSSIPTPQALNPNSILLMSTSPPRPPSSVEPLGHPTAIYEGGPFGIEGRLLKGDKERPELEVVENKPDENEDGTGTTLEEEPESFEGDEAEETGNDENFKLFRTSAKTGEGVEEVFDYCARTILENLSLEVGSPNSLRRKDGGVIKINEREDLSTGQKWKRACCG